MKIGVLGPIWLPIPPVKYGGSEEVVANLVDGLSKNGHSITLFGAKNAKVTARIAPSVTTPLRDREIDWTNVIYTYHHMLQAFHNTDGLDILHVHINRIQDYCAFPLAVFSKIPVVFTLHNELPTQMKQPVAHFFLEEHKELPFVSISNSQRNNLPLHFLHTVYNAVRLEDLPFGEKPQDYFVWLGRIDRKKGTKEAILAAKKAGVKLMVAGHIETGDEEKYHYYTEEVQPLIDNKQIVWLGEIGSKERGVLLAGAKGFLNPILWREPFGLVMAEALATGTPVISFDIGAAPEIITDHTTGFLVHTVEEMADKIQEIDKIDRAACREYALSHFAPEQMVKEYEDVYTSVIAHWPEFIEKQKEYTQKNKGKFTAL